MTKAPYVTAQDPVLPHFRRLIVLRWAVLGGAALSTVLAVLVLEIRLPLWPLALVLALATAWNLHTRHRLGQREQRDGGQHFDTSEFFSQLCVDLAVITALLFFSGGATNPLVFLLLPPVAVAALILPQRRVLAIALLAIIAYSILMVQFVPLPLADPQRAATLHLSGMWVTFVVSVAMISWFILRMTAALRQRDAALAAAREQALRDERVLAMGALAAGAAHELGTPLATLAVLANELEHDARLGAEAHADLQLMREQIAYCKRIITGLTERAGAVRSEGAGVKHCDAWIEELFDDWITLRGFPEASLQKVGAGGTAPRVVVEPTLEQGLVNLLDNALRAGAPVELTLSWTDAAIQIDIHDHGPGFSADDLAQAGRVPFPASAQGSGIGLILTRAAIERLGGHMELGNRAAGGAFVRIELSLDRIGAHG